MKKYFLLIIAIISIGIGSCNSNKTNANEITIASVNPVSEKLIQILYFHGDRRCPTCIKVGEISLNLFNAKYANNPRVKYLEVNTDQEVNKAIAEKYQITSSSLIIDVNGKVKNITIDAFKYAKSDPATLEKMITDIIELGLKE